MYLLPFEVLSISSLGPFCWRVWSYCTITWVPRGMTQLWQANVGNYIRKNKHFFYIWFSHFTWTQTHQLIPVTRGYTICQCQCVVMLSVPFSEICLTGWTCLLWYHKHKSSWSVQIPPTIKTHELSYSGGDPPYRQFPWWNSCMRRCSKLAIGPNVP